MQNKHKLFITLSFLATSLFTTVARADIEWSGVYRIEAISLRNPELGEKRPASVAVPANGPGVKTLEYALTHLVLRPKIVAGDGLTIYGQFDILNNRSYPNSQLGALWGSGVPSVADPTKDPISMDDTNTMTRTQRAETISVSQLYVTLNHEYGQLIVGRAPLHFGLGMTHNAGRGLFDHWYETDDLVGYKLVLGNLYVLPMYGKVSEGGLNASDDLSDLMVQIHYGNPESDMELGGFYQVRKGGDQASDAPTNQPVNTPPQKGAVLGGAGTLTRGGVDIRTGSIYGLKDTSHYRLGVEASFQTGNTGVVSSGDSVTMDGFGIAAEFELKPEGSRWNWGLKGGIASGDDPNTANKFEGFLFNRNYDVAMLMFNHPLGVDDFLRTRLITGKVRDDASGSIIVPDVETISNAAYLAPTVKYSISDHWHLDNTLIMGWLVSNPLEDGKDPGKNLGYEWDLSLNFTPRKGVMWVNQVGVLIPGGVWEGGGQYEAATTFGLQTKAAISF